MNGAVAAVSLGFVVSLVHAADHPLEITARYVLETAQAFRTVYSKTIVEKAAQVGVKPSERWSTEDHAIMLPAQFIKAAGAEIKSFDLGLIGLTPINPANLPKTPAEAEALTRLAGNPDLKVLTFADGNQFKG